jgi:hypothetical protein
MCVSVTDRSTGIGKDSKEAVEIGNAEVEIIEKTIGITAITEIGITIKSFLVLSIIS